MVYIETYDMCSQKETREPSPCLFSSFAGKYAIKSELQTLTQSGLLFGVEGLKYSFNQRLKQGQQPIVTFFPDTEIRAAG